MKKIGKFSVGRDALGRLNIIWVKTHDMEGGGLAISYEMVRPYPPQYGRVVHITPLAMVQSNGGALATAFTRCWENALATDRLLRLKGKRGLRFDRLSFHYTAPVTVTETPTDGEPGSETLNHIVAWKAYAR